MESHTTSKSKADANMVESEGTEIRALSLLLSDFIEDLPADRKEISVKYLLEAFHERGFGVLLLIFAAPMALPIPVPPGINVLLASPLLLLTAQQALGRHTIWMPEKIKSRKISCDRIGTLFHKIIPWLKRIERLLSPRFGWITRDGPSRFFGFLGLIMALTICIPVPLTNTVPSFGIALMAIGVVMRDGLAVLTGAMIGMIWVTILVLAVAILGPEAFEFIKDTVKSLWHI